MMNTKSCGLCFQEILNDSEKLDSEKMQNVLSLLNLDNFFQDVVDVKTTHNVICSRCSKNFQQSYNFRTTCQNNNERLKTMVYYCDITSLLDVIITKNINSEVKCKDENVCRFCLNYFKSNSVMEVNLEQDNVIKDMIAKCLPQFNVNLFQSPCICYICIESLEKCYNFILQCEDNELVKFLRKKTTHIPVNSIATNLNIGTLVESFVKEENCVDIEESNTIENLLQSEDIEETKLQVDTIENQLNTKHSEDTMLKVSTIENLLHHEERCKKSDIQVGTIENLLQTEDIEESKLQVSTIENLLHHEDIKRIDIQFSTVENLLQSEDIEETKLQISTIENQLNTKDGEVTKLQNSTMENLLNPEGIEITDIQAVTIQNLLKAEDIEESKFQVSTLENPLKSEDIEETKLQVSPIQNLVKDEACNVSINEKLNKSTLLGTGKQHKCSICGFETKYKTSLTHHLITHKDLSEITMHKCPVCANEYKFKKNLLRHIKTHMSKEDLELHLCLDCGYQGGDVIYLEEHYLKKHNKDVGDLFYSCKECDYKGNDTILLLLHRKTHRTEYKCKYCSFKSESLYGYVVHSKVHRNGNKSAKEKTYKCDLCKFKTKVFRDFLIHLKAHEAPRRIKRKFPGTNQKKS